MKKLLLFQVFNCVFILVSGQVSATLDSAETFLESDKGNEASVLLERLEKLPDHSFEATSKARLWINLARVKNFKGDYPASLELLIRAENLLKEKHLENRLPVIYSSFGDLFYNLGAYDLSMDHYNKYLRYDHDVKRRFYIFNRIGTIHYKQERYDEAKKIFQEQYLISKDFSTELEELSAFNNIALANLKKGNYGIAVNQFLIVLKGLETSKLSKRDFYNVVCDNIGYTYYSMARYHDAIRYFEKAKGYDQCVSEGLVDLQKLLGECYLRTGQLKKAEELDFRIRKNFRLLSQ